MDKSKNPKNYYALKSKSELYEFYIRKCNILKAISADDMSYVNVKYTARLKHINYATQCLIEKISNHNITINNSSMNEIPSVSSRIL